MTTIKPTAEGPKIVAADSEPAAEQPREQTDADEQAATEDAHGEHEDEAEEEQNPNAEAAKWRHKLKDEKAAHAETRTALQDMTARVEALQRQQIESLVAASGLKPAALWAVTQLDQLVAEDGSVNVEAFTTAIAAARDQLGVEPIGKGTRVPGLGQKPGTAPRAEDAWTQAFKPKSAR